MNTDDRLHLFCKIKYSSALQNGVNTPHWNIHFNQPACRLFPPYSVPQDIKSSLVWLSSLLPKFKNFQFLWNKCFCFLKPTNAFLTICKKNLYIILVNPQIRICQLSAFFIPNSSIFLLFSHAKVYFLSSRVLHNTTALSIEVATLMYWWPISLTNSSLFLRGGL